MQIKNNQELEELFVRNYWGKSVEEIIKWYSPLIAWSTIKDYLIQNRSYDDFVSILIYDRNQEMNTLDKNNSDIYLGFITLMIVLEELTKRIMCMYYYAEDWIAQSNKVNYLRNKFLTYIEYQDFVDQTKNLHYITPEEYKEYIEYHKNINKQHHILQKYYYDYSLYEQVMRHRTGKYNLNQMLKEILNRYDAQFCYLFINNEVSALKHAHIWNKDYVMENLFNTTVWL